MITAHDLLLDQFASEGGSDKRLTTWYAQGQSDALGDRLLMFDNTNQPSWEILRFKPALAHNPKFEAALRQRVEQLSSFQHEAFPLVRPIRRLGHDDGLAVVSTYSTGACLSDALNKPRSVEFALRLVRQLMPALAALQRHATGIAHGALTADRILLNADGRLVIREHMVGSALESLELPSARLWSEFGVLVPPTATVAATLDDRCDVVQLALVAVSLMAGRRIAYDEYPDALHGVLDEIELRHQGHGPRFQNLRYWLERALRLGNEPFDSAQDAEAALARMHDEPPRGSDQIQETLPTVPKEPVTEDSTPPMWSAARRLPTPPPPPAAMLPPAPRATRAMRDRLADVSEHLERLRHHVVRLWRGVPPSAVRWATIVMCGVAVAEAVIIAQLLLARSNAAAVEARAAVPPPSVEVVPIQPPPPAAPPIAVTTTAADAKIPEIRAAAPVAAVVRTGAFRVSASIELHVLDGERVIGSSVDGPIIAAAGRHEFEFVNSALGYRARHVVDVKAGQVTPLLVPVPNGNLNVNAQPWAAVWLDGTSIGETPLGNLSVVPGEHEILFRHPQLGERRERMIVRAGVETRVAVNLQK
jgi:hypothetical protein